MANHAVMIPSKISAMYDGALLRNVISASNVDNGNVFLLSTISGTTGEGEVWNATAPTSASASIWMAGEPEIPFGTAGANEYRGIGNIQDFYNSASKVFTAFKPQPGDIITLTAEAFDTAPSAYAITASGKYTLEANGTAASSGFCLKYLNTTYIPSASGSAIGSGRITAYRCSVVTN
jgi:hypothetical protein